MLELMGLRKIFNQGKATQATALNHLNLILEKEDFVVVVGSNGSGKTTLLNSISGSITLDHGKIILNDLDISALPEYRRSRWIARVFQNPLAGTAPGLSILDNFRLAALRTEKKKLHLGTTLAFKKNVQDHVATLNMGLENKLEQSMGSLSGGQRQALTLIMTIMAKVDILLLDEPTAALDPRSAKMVMELTQKLIKEYRLTAILVTHNLNEALHYGNRLIQLQEGEIIRNLDENEKRQLSHQEILGWFDYLI